MLNSIGYVIHVVNATEILVTLLEHVTLESGIFYSTSLKMFNLSLYHPLYILLVTTYTGTTHFQ